MGCCKSKRNSNNKSGVDSYIDIENQEKELQDILHEIDKEMMKIKQGVNNIINFLFP